MCPITIPDLVAEVEEAIEALTESLGHGKFSSIDVAEWIERRRKARWAAETACVSFFLGVEDGAQWLTDYEAEIDCLEPGELKGPHAHHH